MKYKFNKITQTKLLIYFFISVFLLVSIISINLSQKTIEKINFLIIRISKTSTWYSIKYSSEIFIDRLKNDIFLFFDKNPSNLETFNINMQPADLRRIENIISKKTIFDNLNDKDQKWFPINFNLGSESENYPAKIRIRGDQSIHWINKKKSWKINFTQEKLFKNKKSINLILPKERMMEVELSAYKIAKKNGLLVPDAGFVLVNQNNSNMGLYFWYETIDQFFLERNGYPIGDILSGNDVGLQNDELLDKNLVKFYDLNSATYRAELNHSKEITSIAFLQWKKFLELLKSNDENLINQKIENYLDVSKFAMWNSLLRIFGNTHGQSINNVKWFYDPTTGLFEPIVNDIFIGFNDYEQFELRIDNLMINNILTSSKVRQSILKALNKLVNEQGNFILNTFRETYSQISPYIYSGVEGYNYNLKGVGNKSPSDVYYTHDNRLNILKSNLESIKKTLSSNRLFIETNLNFSNEKSYYKIDIINQGVADVSIKEVIFSSSTEKELLRIGNKISILLTNTEGYKRIIEPTDLKLTKKKWSFEFNNLNLISPRYGNYIKKSINEKNTTAELKWTLHIILQNQNYKNFFDQLPANLEFIISNNLTNKNVPLDNINKSEIILNDSRNLDFAGKEITDQLFDTLPNDNQLITSEIPNSNIVSNNKYILKKNDIIFSSGDYKILKDLIMPDGFNLVVDAGVRLLLAPNVNILLKGGSLNIKGTKSNPVVIDQLIPGKNWGTISVLSSNTISNISYSKIANGGSNTKFLTQGVYYTGQLNFFHSNVNIDNSLISYANSEDAINIKKSSFNIDNVEFAFNKYDAFDGDWVSGEITNSLVHNNGNDGLDFSGSKVVVKNTIFEKMKDKSLSIGEQSKIDIINCRFSNSNYAIAVKDLSEVRIFGSSIFKNNFGIAVYRKKPIFGSGVATVIGGLIWDNLINFSMDENAKIVLDNTGLNKDVILNNIKKINLRIGNINEEYTFDSNNNPLPVDKKKLSILFLKGPITNGKDLNGNYLPNLSNNYIGMIQPLKFNGKFN